MMIGVPSHVVIAVDGRAALCFLGRADALAAVPRRRTANARASILDKGMLMPLYISTSSRYSLLARGGQNVVCCARQDGLSRSSNWLYQSRPIGTPSQISMRYLGAAQI